MDNINHKDSKVGFIAITDKESEVNEPSGIEALFSAAKSVIGDMASIIDENDNEKYDIIFASWFTDDVKDVVAIYERYHLDSVVMIGGPSASVHKECLYSMPEAFLNIGEGETTVIAVCKGKDLRKDVPNLCYLHKGEIVSTHREVCDLSDLRYCQEYPLLIDTIKKNGLVRCESGRGCDYGRCRFCTVSKKYNGHGRRHYPITDVIFEIEKKANSGARTIVFSDEEFIGKDMSFSEEVIDEIYKMKRSGRIPKDVHFQASISVWICKRDWERAKKIITKMKEVGFDSLFIGIESGSDTQLRRYGKGVTAKDNERMLKFISELGINADIGFIMFDPLMSFHELKENIEFAERTGLNRSSCRIIKKMILFKDTPYTRSYENYSKLNGLSCDSLDDPYYVDDNVREVLNRLGKIECDRDLYGIQTRIRMGNASEKEIVNLIQCRLNDFNRLKNIVMSVDKEMREVRM